MILVIMGVSGSGKSTIGKLLAARLGCEFLDADEISTIIKDAQGLLGIKIPIREEEISEFVKRKGKEGKQKGLSRSDLQEIFC